jgi:hypothetical protein
VCHADLTRYELRPVTAFKHGPGFLRSHGADARAAGESCATCHEQSFCSDCHAKTAPAKPDLLMPERVLAEFIHRGDFISRHAMEARADPALCLRCHGTSGCDSCHEAQRLSTSAANPLNPHPASWRVATGARLHADAARQNIASCAGCHDQGAASICVDCHRVGGMGGNPHPKGWSSRHPKSEISSNGMCLSCHR